MEERRSPDWSRLQPELLELVVTKLHFIDVLHFKGVCSSFRLAAKVRSSVTPLLMHQLATDHGDEDEFLRKFGKTVRFLNPEGMNALIYSPQRKKCLDRLLDNGCCVGSSHGWLVVLDKEVNPFLLNPFSGAEIELPKKETLPGIINKDYSDIRVDCDGGVKILSFVKSTYDGVAMVAAIQKAILTGNPSYEEEYKVFVICGYFPMEVAFCCRGDRTWRTLSCSYEYCDVAVHNGRLYAIGDVFSPPVNNKLKICIWDLRSNFEVPQKCGRIVISDFLKQVDNKFRDCTVRCYLVSSAEGLFLVFKFMVNAANTTADDVEDYRTVGFEIYKLEGEHGKELVRVESLPSQAMFLGGNHGMIISVQECDNKLNKNTIYFTYDYWDPYLRCFNYDIGTYSLENGSVNFLCDVQKKKPVPFWVFPGQK